MPMNLIQSDEVARIRNRIDHPIIDADGHYRQFKPLVRDILKEVAGRTVVERFDRQGGRGGHLPSRSFWGFPAEMTEDRMTAALPCLMYQRLDQIGIDFAIAYPTPGMIMTEPDAEIRQAVFRAFNIYAAEQFAEFRDRICPVAIIPTFTPEEAIAELEYAVGTLGLRCVRLEGTIPRDRRPDGTPAAWVDTLGHGSLYDYDPVWQKCAELKVVPSFHGVGFGWGSRTSATNYVYNHIGCFSSAQEAVCRSLVMGGVPRRFEGLTFAFLEGGAAWAIDLLMGLLGHYGKRNKNAIHAYDPSRFNLSLGMDLFKEHARGRLAVLADAFDADMRQQASTLEPLGVDDFRESGIESAEDLIRIFKDQFFFGCEADDPLNALAFDRRFLPKGGRINAFFSSDIGHWDVPDMRYVLCEAWEQVEEELLSVEQFRDFSFGTAHRMLTTVNPDFFAGTVLKDVAPTPRRRQTAAT
jgi:predicted TIM-barrel fold metal-dependent hydrolase